MPEDPQDKDSYEFQRARVIRLAAELGKQVEFDEAATWIKFRATEAGAKFKATPHSGELMPSLLADKPDSWIKALILKLASLKMTVEQRTKAMDSLYREYDSINQ